ncbi:MAG TPA: 2-phospho-L-lactate transferase [Anaerolineales bacterium]|nr:2-phospho-L-lactate transferase [Anaerolineales bacterium]
MKIVALAGGVGGAKMAEGLAHVLPAIDLTVVVNTGDDFEHFGLTICPDLDTVCYTLAGLANLETGWGRADESQNALREAALLGGPTWFSLGDRDLGTHLERTRRLNAGDSLSAITADFCRAWGIEARVLPMSDQPARTIVDTDQGELPFQEYFVAHACEPRVRGFRFAGVEQAKPAPGVLDEIATADLAVICPSNPWVSVAPILAVPGIREAIAEKVVLAVSPIIGGKAVKGPAAKMFSELGIEPSALAVAQYYKDLLRGFVFDEVDSAHSTAIHELGIMPFAAATIMQDRADRARLAGQVIDFGRRLLDK